MLIAADAVSIFGCSQLKRILGVSSRPQTATAAPAAARSVVAPSFAYRGEDAVAGAMVRRP